MIAGSNLTKGFAGQITDSTLHNNTSFAAEEIIEFGRPLMRGSLLERQVKNFVADVGRTKKFLGISIRDPQQISNNYAIGQQVAVCEMGTIEVPLTTGLVVLAGDNAYLNQVTNNITNISTADQIVIGRFRSGGTSNGLTGSALFTLDLIPGFQI